MLVTEGSRTQAIKTIVSKPFCGLLTTDAERLKIWGKQGVGTGVKNNIKLYRLKNVGN
jgi:hypothetical protein